MRDLSTFCFSLVLLLAARSGYAEEGFRLISPAQSGLQHTCPLDLDHPDSRVYGSSSACGGVVVADFTGNGKPELFFINGPGSNKLYREQSKFSYKDITKISGLSDLNRWGNGAAAADVDNDGDLDLYVCNYDAPNELWINESKPGDSHPTFEERAAEWGLDIVDASVMPAFADYDRDGLLDVYLLTYRLDPKGGRPKDIQVQLSKDRKSGVILGDNSRYYQYTGFEEGGHTYGEVARRDIC